MAALVAAAATITRLRGCAALACLRAPLVASRGVSSTTATKKGEPLFRDVWRKFQLKVHPDLFTRYPELQEANSSSLKKLQGILNQCKSTDRTTDEHLKACTEKLEFFLRTDRDASFIRVAMEMKLPAGNYSGRLRDQMGQIFKHAGLPTNFAWGPDYFRSKYYVPKRTPEEEEMDEEMAEEYRRRQQQQRGAGSRYA